MERTGNSESRRREEEEREQENGENREQGALRRRGGRERTGNRELLEEEEEEREQENRENREQGGEDKVEKKRNGGRALKIEHHALRSKVVESLRIMDSLQHSAHAY